MDRKYSHDELRRAVRIERMELQQELIKVTRRAKEIEERMVQLDKADDLLDGP